MKKKFFVVLGCILICVCVYGLFQYRVLTWLIFLILGVYFLSKARTSSNDVINGEYEKEVAVLPKKTQSISEVEKSFTFPIVGVTFKNDDGSDRQKLLRKIYFKDSPFDAEQNVFLERYLWNNKPAYYVKVNDYIVGNISADFVWYFEENSNRPYKIESINVFGGGNKNYGAEIHGIYLDV